jgi:glycosyltransferase involved in cell wall biosynthesis
MRVVHVPFGYYPDPVGGTEVYVAGLASGLRARGVESVVVAPASASGEQRYEHQGTPVYRFTLPPSERVEELYGDGDAAAADAIASIVDEVRADVLHLHAFTRAASLRAAKAARRCGAAVVFTYHTPTASCVRGTLMRDGHAPCDGVLDARRCTACLLESRGLPLAIREPLSHVPATLSAALASGAKGSWATAVRARELTTSRHNAFRGLLKEADAVVAVCEWVRALLLSAGADPSTVMLSRQGTPIRVPTLPTAARTPRADAALRLAFVGRMHPAKGVHVAVSALSARPDLAATLDVFATVQDDDGARYRSAVCSAVAGDARIRLCGPVPQDRVVETLAGYDATVVPSQWLETGPLTVLESFAAGVPVIGSDLGGIAELVTHDRDGWLVPHSDVRAWSAAIERLASERALVERLRGGVRRPRSTEDVARDMVSIYESVVPRRRGVSFASTAGVA